MPVANSSFTDRELANLRSPLALCGVPACSGLSAGVWSSLRFLIDPEWPDPFVCRAGVLVDPMADVEASSEAGKGYGE